MRKGEAVVETDAQPREDGVRLAISTDMYGVPVTAPPR